MRFFNIQKTKEIVAITAKGAAIVALPVMSYYEIQEENKTAEAFRKQYPNANVYFKPRVIAGMGGAHYVIAEDKDTGQVIAKR